MRRAFLFFALVLLTMLSRVSWAWDHVYDGSVLPNDPSLGTDKWAVGGTGDGLSMCSTDGNVLQINDTANAAVVFARGALSGPITMESRVRVTNGSEWENVMGIGTSSFSTSAVLYPSYLQVFFDYGNSPITYLADLTTFHTIRVAINAQGQSYTWLDQTLVAQGVTHVGGQGLVFFGNNTDGSGLGQSYWDYVAYSNEFLPIPEPSSLLALAGGLAGLALRRRRR